MKLCSRPENYGGIPDIRDISYQTASEEADE